MRNVLEKVVEKMKTYSLFSNVFFPENRAVCEIMSKNVMDPGLGGAYALHAG